MEKDFTSENLSKLLLFAYDNQSFFIKKGLLSEILNKYRKVKHRLNENTKSRSKKNISFHYDLGNEFYKLWLDPSMTYSSGIFTNSNKDLHIAQKNKYKQIANNLNLNENSNVLEIGCGWGGFSSYIAKEYGSTVNAITISKEQFEFTSKKIFNEGLNEKVNVEMRDYRDIDKKYTNIASIEMFEAVGKKYWKVFFNILKESLSEDGSAALQIITIKDENDNDPIIISNNGYDEVNFVIEENEEIINNVIGEGKMEGNELRLRTKSFGYDKEKTLKFNEKTVPSATKVE